MRTSYLPVRFSALTGPMDRLFDTFLRATPATEEAFVHPSLNVWETDDAYHVEAELPGYTREEIDLTLQDGELGLKAEHLATEETQGENGKSGDDVTWLRRERTHRVLRRTLRLPTDVDPAKVEASLENGVLTITLPKAEETRPRKIEVKT